MKLLCSPVCPNCGAGAICGHWNQFIRPPDWNLRIKLILLLNENVWCWTDDEFSCQPAACRRVWTEGSVSVPTPATVHRAGRDFSVRSVSTTCCCCMWGTTAFLRFWPSLNLFSPSARCETPCLFGSRCVQPNVCACRVGFAGARCSQRVRSTACWETL